MKKTLITLLVLILIATLAFPFIMGKIVEKQFRSEIKAINQFNKVKISIVDYRNGWFSSFAQLKIERKIPYILAHFNKDNQVKLPSTFVYVANLRIHHGPMTLAYNLQHHQKIIWGQGVVTGEIIPTSQTIAGMSEFKNIGEPTKVFAIVSLNGKMHVSLTHPGVEVINHKAHSVMSFSNLASSFNLNQKATNLSGKININQVDFSAYSVKTALSSIDIAFNYKLDPSHFLTGTQVGQIADIDVSLSDQSLADFKKVHWKIAQRTKDDKLNADYQLSVDAANVLSANFDNIALSTQVNHISLSHVKALRQFAASNLPLSRQRDRAFLRVMAFFFEGVNIKLKNFQVNTAVGKVVAKGVWQFPEKLGIKNRLHDLVHQSRGVLHIMVPDTTSSLSNPVGFELGPAYPGVSLAKPDPVKTFLTSMINSAAARGDFIKSANKTLTALIAYQKGILTLNKRPLFKMQVKHKGADIIVPMRLRSPIENTKTGEDK